MDGVGLHTPLRLPLRYASGVRAYGAHSTCPRAAQKSRHAAVFDYKAIDGLGRRKEVNETLKPASGPPGVGESWKYAECEAGEWCRDVTHLYTWTVQVHRKP